MRAEDSGFYFERNTEFRGPWIRVFMEHEEATELSVNPGGHAQMSMDAPIPVPSHEAGPCHPAKVGMTVEFTSGTLEGCTGCSGNRASRSVTIWQF